MSLRASTRGFFISILAACLARTTLTSSARAESSPHETEAAAKVGGLIQGFSTVSVLFLDGRNFVDRAPYQAAGLRFQGAGRAVGGGVEMLLNVDRLRFGFDATLFTVSGVELGHVPFGSDLRATLSSPFGSDIAFSLGRELAFGPVHPYFDVRLGVSFLKWNIDAHSSRLGDLTSLDGTLVAPLVAPRLGMSIRLGSRVNLDVAATASPFSLARVGALLGLGVYTDAFEKEARPWAAPEP